MIQKYGVNQSTIRHILAQYYLFGRTESLKFKQTTKYIKSSLNQELTAAHEAKNFHNVKESLIFDAAKESDNSKQDKNIKNNTQLRKESNMPEDENGKFIKSFDKKMSDLFQRDKPYIKDGP